MQFAYILTTNWLHVKAIYIHFCECIFIVNSLTTLNAYRNEYASDIEEVSTFY